MPCTGNSTSRRKTPHPGNKGLELHATNTDNHFYMHFIYNRDSIYFHGMAKYRFFCDPHKHHKLLNDTWPVTILEINQYADVKVEHTPVGQPVGACTQ